MTDSHTEVEMDADAAKAALSSIAASTAATATREAELASIKINKADVAVLVEQLEVTADVADRRLRLNGGDLKAALTELITA